jgi:RNA polymerase sigma-70 factor (ECF subfamily)
MSRIDPRDAFDRYKDTVFRFAWRMTNSVEQAEDVTQEVFLALLQRPDGYDPALGSLRGFLVGAARNQMRKRWRDADRWTDLDEDTLFISADQVEQHDVASIVGEAIQALPPMQREVLILAEYEDLSLEEIARAVDAEVGTVKSRLFRARENLRRALAPLRDSRRVHGTIKR